MASQVALLSCLSAANGKTLSIACPGATGDVASLDSAPCVVQLLDEALRPSMKALIQES